MNVTKIEIIPVKLNILLVTSGLKGSNNKETQHKPSTNIGAYLLSDCLYRLSLKDILVIKCLLKD